MAEREYSKITTRAKPDSDIVTVRCGPCVRRLGRSSPALMVVEVDNPATGDMRLWRVTRISARQRDKIRARGDIANQEGEELEKELGSQGLIDLWLSEDDPDELPPDEDADRAPWISVGSWDRSTGRLRYPRSVELVCPQRRCRHRPRVRVRDLFKLAEQAAAKGRAEIYV